MKRLLVLAITIFVLFLSALPIYAQSVGIGLNVGTKSILGDSVPVDLSVNSPVSTGPVKVQWIIPYGMTVDGGHPTSFNETLTDSSIIQDHIVLSYLTPGLYPITANVSGVYNGVTFNKSQSVNLVIDNNMNVVNTNNEYTLKKVLFIFLFLVAAVLSFVKILIPYKYFRVRFSNWLNKEGES